MRIRTRLLAVPACLAVAADFTFGQGVPVNPPIPGERPAGEARFVPPAVLPPTIPAQAPSPESAPMPVPTTPMTPLESVEPLTPLPSAGVPGCATCNTPTGPVADGVFTDTHKGPRDAVWTNYDYMMNWFRPAPLPFPVAVGSANGTGPTLLGETRINYNMQSGGRIEIGTWTNDRHTFGTQLGGFIIEQRSQFVTVAAPVMSRPFFDVLALTPNAVLVAQPGLATGEVAIGSSARFSGAEYNAWWNIAETDKYSFNLFAGFRYLDLDEALAIYQTTRPAGGSFLVGGAGTEPVTSGEISLVDRFRTRNQFYGGQIGSRMEARHGILFMNITPRIGIGSNHQTVQTDGRTTVTGREPIAGGLLALGTTGTDAGRTGNNGRDITNRFTLITEVGSQFGVQVTDALRLSVGYNFLFMNNVARPGNQVSTVVNPRQVPVSAAFDTLSGPAAPQQTFDRESFWVHGISFTATLMY